MVMHVCIVSGSGYRVSLSRDGLSMCAVGYLVIWAIQPQDLRALLLTGLLLDADGGAIVPVCTEGAKGHTNSTERLSWMQNAEP